MMPGDDVLTKPVARRIEVFTGAGGRRKWSAEAKARIVAESYAASVVEVADRYGLAKNQLFTWRREARTKVAAEPGASALERIKGLYAVEADIRGRPADERRAERQERSKPIVQALEPWLRAKLEILSQKSKLAEAIRYALTRWDGLTRFLDDGRIEIDSNVVERSIRPIALNRKKCPIRRLRWRCGALGSPRFVGRDLQAQSRRA